MLDTFSHPEYRIFNIKVLAAQSCDFWTVVFMSMTKTRVRGNENRKKARW